MTRPPRLEFAGARYHVINRGNFRQDLFTGEGAAEAFETTLGEAAERFGWRVAAFVLMRDHFHLALQTPEANLSAGMKWLQGTWVRRVSRSRQAAGQPFQGRFKSLVVEDGERFMQVCDYIHLNPARAGVVKAGALAEYRTGSLWRYLQGGYPGWLDGAWLLGAAGGLPESGEGWRSYAARLAAMMDDPVAREQLSAARLSRGWCIGGAAFKSGLRKTMQAQLDTLRMRRFAGLDAGEVREERREAWEEALKGFSRVAKIDLAALPRPKSAPEKVLLAAAMKRTSSVSNGWLAERLGMGQPASVSQFVRRCLLGEAGAAQVAALIAEVARGEAGRVAVGGMEAVEPEPGSILMELGGGLD